MPTAYKPKPIKGLKIIYNGETYDKIVYMSCSNEGISFENMQNESTMVNIRCPIDKIKLELGPNK